MPHEQIYSEILRRIRSGMYGLGEKLSESKLADEFVCSRMPVREAFKHLEQDGVLTILPKSGTYVRSYTVDEIRHAIEIRAYLESLAFTLAIEQGVEASSMRFLLDRMQANMQSGSFDITSFGEDHYQFHRELVMLSGNPLLLEIYNKLHLHAVHRIFFNPMTEHDMAITHNEHEKIIQFIRNRDPRGSKFIIRHLWNRKRNTLLGMSVQEEEA